MRRTMREGPRARAREGAARLAGGLAWALVVALGAPLALADDGEAAPPVAPAADGSSAPDKPAPRANPVAAPVPDRGPLGASGGDSVPTRPVDRAQHFAPIEDRWRIGFPSWNRYPDTDGKDIPFTEGKGILDPYHQNVLKGDYPILEVPKTPFPTIPHIGGDLFMVLTLQSDTIAEVRSFPVPGGISTERAGNFDFFGKFDQFFFVQNGTVSLELFQGDTAFRPKDWAVKATAVANINYVSFEERGLANRNVEDFQDDRLDGHIGMQELLVDIHLADLSVNYDTLTLTAGIQPFTSDFRGFLYSDNNLGARLTANHLSNRIQWNVAWFRQLEKDTNSLLNKFDVRDQDLFIANLFVQDFIALGYTAHLSWHLNWDRASTHFDTNRFLVRPSPIGAVAGALPGDVREKDIFVHYLGWGGEGHIGRFNISHQYYFAFGRDDFNEIAGRSQNIRGHMLAIEPSVDLDWLRVKGNFFYQSGDKNPRDGTAHGFDTIFDNPFFAGAAFSYWNRQNVPFVQTGVQLVNRFSMVSNLRSTKFEGQANFVNPGLFLLGGGLSARITPKLFADLNVNYMMWQHTESLELTQVQDGISREIGLDYSLGLQYRPILTDNIILTAGVAGLTPGRGFRDIYGAQTLYSGFLAATFTY